jgi:hypothetical protein
VRALFGPRLQPVRDVHTEQGRRDVIARMRAASASFYGAATQTGCHAFIEFTGIINQFIEGCVSMNMLVEG